MSALTAARALAAGVRLAAPDAECVIVPMADGGEGTAQTITDALGGQLISVPCHDALGRVVTASYGWIPEQRLAVIETAAASGLERIAPPDRNVAVASSFGTGELIKAALVNGAQHLILGLGGSATNDAGAGIMAALGARFLDGQGRDLPPGGLALRDLARIDVSGIDPRLAGCVVEAACDVDNPLLGSLGASAVFGPQKGADPALVAKLDGALANWAAVVQRDVGIDVAELPGGGAAGGIGAALAGFTNATLRTGVQIVIDAVKLREKMPGADWVFTGEGRIDSQTAHGKTPWGVAQVAAEFEIPVIAFAGKVNPDANSLLVSNSQSPTNTASRVGFVAVVPIIREVTDLPTALGQGPANLSQAAEMVTRLLIGSNTVRHS